MKLYFRLFIESLIFALNALIANKLRTFLSLLGITIGIFAIISVFTMVDSLENKIRDSVASLGDNVIFVQKWPWSFGPDYPWWKYWQRPLPSVKEMEEIRIRSFHADAVCFMASVKKNINRAGNSVENVSVTPVSHEYERVKNLEFEHGRYFSEIESKTGKNVSIIGANLAQVLFDDSGAIGRELKIFGRKYTIIGILRKEGESIVQESMDNQLLIPVNNVVAFIDLKSENANPTIMVKAKPGIVNSQLLDELTGIMRSVRKLKPKADPDFALNESSLLSSSFDQLFGVVNLAGAIIGLFSIVVGGFGIANIMFVSVKERTHIIGIQKSLGAKNDFILFQFLSEAILLCVIGGIIGLIMVFGVTLIINSFLDFGIFLSFKNVITGIGISASIGLLSGVIPAFLASRLSPVEAIRSN